jgi:hypothetical protein
MDPVHSLPAEIFDGHIIFGLSAWWPAIKSVSRAWRAVVRRLTLFRPTITLSAFVDDRVPALFGWAHAQLFTRAQTSIRARRREQVRAERRTTKWLMHAAAYGQLHCLKECIARGGARALPNSELLEAAAAHGQLAVVLFLLSWQPLYRTKERITNVMVAAAKSGSSAAVSIMEELFAVAESECFAGSMYIVEAAAAGGHFGTFLWCETHLIPLSMPHYSIALLAAAQNGHTSIMARCRPYATVDIEKVLMLSAGGGHADSVAYCITEGATDFMPALGKALSNNRRDFVLACLEPGHPHSMTGINHLDLLCSAAGNGCIWLVDKLVSSGLCAKCPDGGLEVALRAAALGEQCATMRYLKNAGAKNFDFALRATTLLDSWCAAELCVRWGVSNQILDQVFVGAAHRDAVLTLKVLKTLGATAYAAAHLSAAAESCSKHICGLWMQGVEIIDLPEV